MNEIDLNLSSRVVLSNRTTYIISPFGLLLHEANCCQRHESTLDVFALPTTIRVDPDEACRPTGHQCRGKNRENSQKFAHFRATKTKTRHGVTSQISLAKTLEKKVYRPIWRQITTDILQSEKLHHTHSVSIHRRSNTSSGATEGSSMARLSTTSNTLVYMKQNVLKSFPSVAWPKEIIV